MSPVSLRSNHPAWLWASTSDCDFGRLRSAAEKQALILGNLRSFDATRDRPVHPRFTGRSLQRGPMTAFKLSAAGALILALLAPASADERLRCLSRNEQRDAIAQGQAVPLATARRALPGRTRELVRARLCEDSGRLIYLLTTLARDGKVRHATIDATNGTFVSER